MDRRSQHQQNPNSQQQQPARNHQQQQQQVPQHQPSQQQQQQPSQQPDQQQQQERPSQSFYSQIADDVRRDLENRFRNMADLHKGMRYFMQLFVPDIQHCNMSYFHGILSDEIQVFYNNEVRHVQVPQWPELSVARIMPLALQIPGFRELIPPHWPQTLKVDRKFFWGILVTLDANWVFHMIHDIRLQRYERKQARQQAPRGLTISSTWADRLSAIPYVSSARAKNPSLLISRRGGRDSAAHPVPAQSAPQQQQQPPPLQVRSANEGVGPSQTGSNPNTRGNNRGYVMMDIRILPTHMMAQASQQQQPPQAQTATHPVGQQRQADLDASPLRMNPGTLYNVRLLQEQRELSALRRRHHQRQVEEGKRSALEDSPEHSLIVPPMDAARYADARGLRNPEFSSIAMDHSGIVPFRGSTGTEAQLDEAIALMHQQFEASNSQAQGFMKQQDREQQSRSNLAEPSEQIQPRNEGSQGQPVFQHLKLNAVMEDATPGYDEGPDASQADPSVANRRNDESNERMRTASPVKPEPGTTRYSQLYDPSNRRRAAYFGMAERSSNAQAQQEGDEASQSSQPQEATQSAQQENEEGELE